MKITGKIEVFKSKRGYLTGILKSFNKDNEVVGKIFIDVQGLDLKDERTYNIEVTEGYLNVHHVESLTKDFDKLVIKVAKHKLIDVYPRKEGEYIQGGETDGKNQEAKSGDSKDTEESDF